MPKSKTLSYKPLPASLRSLNQIRKARRSSYPCSECGQPCTLNTIECCLCKTWTHFACTKPGEPDLVSANILQLVHPVLLLTWSPRAVQGDGNCMYRAVSLALFGSEDH